MIFKNATMLCPHGFELQDMAFHSQIDTIGKITTLNSQESTESDDIQDLGGQYVVPGLIDIHSHGAMGKDASDGVTQDLQVLSQYYASQGVTAWCPTTMTLQEAQLSKAVEAIHAFSHNNGAKSLGIYLEGPFFHYDKRGAQSAKNLAKPDFQMFKRLYDLAEGDIAVLALAPELEGGMELVEQASKMTTVSLGHSTADYECAMTAFEKGASLATHLFNGMGPYAHRAPGIVGATIDSNAYGEMICDGLHIHPSMVASAFRLFGDKLCLISDSLRCAGMPDGEYVLGGQPIFKKDGVARLADGTLAGSSIGLLDGVKKVLAMGISPEQVFYAASTAPAFAVGKQAVVGSLEEGKSADFLVLDQDFNLCATYVDGKKVYQAKA